MQLDLLRYLREYDKGRIDMAELYRIYKHFEIQCEPVLKNYADALTQISKLTLENDRLRDQIINLKEAYKKQVAKCARQREVLQQLNAKLKRINEEEKHAGL